MTEGIYSNFASKARRVDQSPVISGPLSLKDIFQRDLAFNWSLLSADRIASLMYQDIKLVLELDSIYEMIESFSLDNALALIKEDYCQDEGQQLPELGGMYQNLAPLLLRSLLENSSEESEQADELIRGWKEALRIAIEEELYLLQDRFHLTN